MVLFLVCDKVENIFGNFLNGALRNPSAAAGERPMLFLGMALTEALGIFALVVAFLVLFS